MTYNHAVTVQWINNKNYRLETLMFSLGKLLISKGSRFQMFGRAACVTLLALLSLTVSAQAQGVSGAIEGIVQSGNHT